VRHAAKNELHRDRNSRARAKKRAPSAASILPKSTGTGHAPSKSEARPRPALAILETTPVSDSIAPVIARLHGNQINRHI
jgi:hypothetical protein